MNTAIMTDTVNTPDPKPTKPTPPPVTTSRYPVVEFEYPDSETGHMKLRYLRVISADADYIKGTELESPYSTKDGQFKQFSRNRLVRQAPTLVTF